MSSFKRSLRTKNKDDLTVCNICKINDQISEMLFCNHCKKFYHPFKCLNLNKETIDLIRKEKQKHHPMYLKFTTDSNVSNNQNIDWSCYKCKICYICRNNIRYTRNNLTKLNNLEICDNCDEGFHHYCNKVKSEFKMIKNMNKKLCTSCLQNKNKIINLEEDDNVLYKLNRSTLKNSNPNLKETKSNGNKSYLNNKSSKKRDLRLTRSKTSFILNNDFNSKEEYFENESESSLSKEDLLSELSYDGKVNVLKKRIALRQESKRKKKKKVLEKKYLNEDNLIEKKKKNLMIKLNDNHDEIDNNKDKLCCIVPGCDLKGNLNGKDNVHYTISTCPLFHNLTYEECQERYKKRKKFKTHLCNELICQTEKSPTSKLENTNKCNSQNILNSTKGFISPRKSLIKKSNLKDMHLKLINERLENKQKLDLVKKSSKVVSYMREPNLEGLTPIFDYQMFREAQCRAAELIQNELKQNPIEINNKVNSYSKRCCLSSIQMGKYEMDIWFNSPYPDEYLNLPKLYICEFCLKYFSSPIILERHSVKCVLKCPPGNEIYRKNNISFFEIDGEKNKYYCQNLCLLSKLFLDHKTLYYDVEPFKFYIMTLSDTEGFHIVGYFSKEKNSFLNYNVSCILTLPPYQNHGYGRMLIDFSYLLSKVERKVGSPEKPLSDLGLISYRSYWKSVILEYLNNYVGENISIKDLSQETAINAYDIVSTLQSLGMLKYWKGKHLVLKRKDILDEYKSKMKKKKNNLKTIDPSCLCWEPDKLSNKNS